MYVLLELSAIRENNMWLGELPIFMAMNMFYGLKPIHRTYSLQQKSEVYKKNIRPLNSSLKKYEMIFSGIVTIPRAYKRGFGSCINNNNNNNQHV